MNYKEVSNEEDRQATIEALKQNGFEVEVTENLEQAKQTTLKLIPNGSEVMTMSSVTLDEAGISAAVNETKDYQSVKNELFKLDREKDSDKMRKLAAAPDYAIGSVHAVSEDGSLYIASLTGSQLPAYAYTAGKVIFVVGTQKLVKNKKEALKRIYEYTLPLESKRAHEAYGVPGSAVNKLLEINTEIIPGRIHIILIKQSVGF